MVSKVRYYTAVDLSTQGSFMNHVKGFVDGCKSLGCDIKVYGFSSKEEAEFNSVIISKNKILNQLYFDLYTAFSLLKYRNKEGRNILRPYRYTLMPYVVAWVFNIDLIKESNGIIEDELVRHGKFIQAKTNKLIEKYLAGKIKKNVCVSSGIVEYYRSFGHKNTALVPNGIDFYKVQNSSPKPITHQVHFLFIGKLINWQGILEFSKWLDQGSSKYQVVLTIIGEGSIRKNLEDLKESVGYRMNLIGWSNWDDIVKFSKEVNIAIIPRIDTTIKGSPLKLMDYLCLNLPTWSTAIDGVKDVPGMDKLVFIFDYNSTLDVNIENWQNFKLNLFENESQRKRIIKNMSWKKNAENILKSPNE